MKHHLTLNQGDLSEARIYYCAHFVAQALGLFAQYDLDVDFITAATGGHTILGGQVPAVVSGDADLAIAGPMVLMKSWQEQGPDLVCFCASVQANPWFLAAAKPQPDFSPENLRGKRVIDVGNVGTATLSFRWLLDQHGLSDAVTLEPGSGDADADYLRVQCGEADYALHAMHALAPRIATGELHSVASLAPLCGNVPWSAYVARRDRLAAQRPAFQAFSAALADAQRWMAEQPAASIAEQIHGWYPGFSFRALTPGWQPISWRAFSPPARRSRRRTSNTLPACSPAQAG